MIISLTVGTGIKCLGFKYQFMKSVWTGDIGFGLVTIPIKLYSANQGSELDFDLLDKRDHARIRYKRVNEDTGREVKWSDIVKGYNLDGKYVILTQEDFENASPEKTKRIEIMHFVDAMEIDSIYFDGSYYIEPTKSGAKPYALFREALRKTKKAGLGSYVLRNREHLATIAVSGNTLLLNQIRFPEEIRQADDLDIPLDKKLPPEQIKMAVALIEQMSAPFEVDKLKDTYSAKLMKLIKLKSKGKGEYKPKMKISTKRGSDDLLSLLKDSLKSTKRKIS